MPAIDDRTWWYIPAHQIWSRDGSVSGSFDPDYPAAWLADDRPGYPVRSLDTSLSATITNPAGPAGLVALINTNLSVAAAITGDLTGSVPAGALGENGIRLNGFVDLPEATVSSVDVDVSGNAETVVVGGVVIGARETLTPLRIEDAEIGFDDFADDAKQMLTGVLPYDRGGEARTWKGSQVYTDAEWLAIQAWWRAQRALSRPSLIIPDPNVNDAWLVRMGKPTATVLQTDGAPTLWLVKLSFEELPRNRHLT